MNPVLIISCALVIGYFLVKLTQGFVQIFQGNIIYPVTGDELANIRKNPERKLDPPVFKAHKKEIIIYVIFLVFFILLFILSIIFAPTNFTFYPFLFILLFYLYDLINLFAILEQGILIGNRFIPWRKIKYFEFIKVDLNSKYYGYAKEVNNQYELKFKLKFFSVNCFILSDESKEHVRNLLQDYIEERHTELVSPNE